MPISPGLQTPEQMKSEILSVYRTDPFVKKYLDSLGVALQEVESVLDDVESQLWLDRITWHAAAEEELLSLKVDPSRPIEDRRYSIMAKWRSGGKSDLSLLQAVANAWKNGEVNVAFKEGKIQLTFNSTFGVPSDMPGLMSAMDEVKPAHLAIMTIYNYLLIRDVEQMTIAQLETMTMDKFAF